jgi:hypothetical protein
MIDVVREEQLKLGYRREIIRLYYPLLSLNRFLGTEQTAEEMADALAGFCEEVKDCMGAIEISQNAGRFCFCLPEEASEYVHEHADESGFLQELVTLIGHHGTSIEDVIALFRRYSDRVCIEPMENGEFDLLLYFSDGVPDAYYYCLTKEMGHVIYHRYTKEDYEDLML